MTASAVLHRICLGLGDTETGAGADWSLPAQADSVIGLLDRLGLGRVAVVGHDQGGAIAQLIAIQHPDRVAALVLADAEAYDNWPSADVRGREQRLRWSLS